MVKKTVTSKLNLIGISTVVLLLFLFLVPLAAFGQTYANVPLTGDAANSTTPGLGSIAATLTDTFAYNPDTPTSPMPETSMDETTGFRAAESEGVDVILYYDLTGGPLTVPAGDSLWVDLYGKSSGQDRDDDVDVELLSGGAGGTLVAAVNGLMISDGATPHVRASFLAPATFDTIRVVGHDTALSSSNKFCLMEIRAVTVTAAPPSTAQFAPWSYGTSDPVSLVEVCDLAGRYATADRVGDRIEIRDIRGDVQDTITSAQIQALMPWADISGGTYGPCSMAFTPSGRYLFIGVCSDPSSSSPKDAILQFNTNTKELLLFNRLTIASSLSEASNFGMCHYAGDLYVGTDSNVLVYEAQRNTKSNSTVKRTIVLESNTAVTAIAVDFYEEQLYMTTPTGLYNVDIRCSHTCDSVTGEIVYGATPINAPQLIATGSGFTSLGMGRAYGGATTEGMFVHQRVDSSTSNIDRVDFDDLNQGGSVTLIPYTTISGDLRSMDATPCGRVLLGTPSPQIMSDGSDTRMDFESWLVDYFENNIKSFKQSLDPVYPGVRSHNINAAGEPEKTRDRASIWFVNKMILADYILGDPDAEQIVQEAVTRVAGTNLSIIPPERNIDGIDGKDHDPVTGLYNQYPSTLSVKGTVTGAAAALEYYGDTNPEIKEACELILRDYFRMADYFHTPGCIQKPVTNDYGPNFNDKHFGGWTGEQMPCASFMGAADPLLTADYWEYLHDPSNARIESSVAEVAYYWEEEQFVDGEACVDPDSQQYDFAFYFNFSEHQYTNPGWRTEFYSQVAKTNAWTDDITRGAYLACPNFGLSPAYLGYPGDRGHGRILLDGSGAENPVFTTDLDQVMTYCAFGDTYPAVCCYMAYREGRTIDLQDGPGWDGVDYNARMLDKFTRFVPDWTPPETYSKFGVLGAAALISPNCYQDSGYLQSFVKAAPEPNDDGQGNTELDYSRVISRRVLGSDDGVNWVSYGFQYAPFTFPDGQSYQQYKVEDPEGQNMSKIIYNYDFEHGLMAWNTDGDYAFGTQSAPGQRIVGSSGSIETNTSITDPQASLWRTLDMDTDFSGTDYIVRGNALLNTPGAPGRGFLRVEWDNDTDPLNGVVDSAISGYLNAANPRVEFRVDTQKSARYMHLSFVVEGVSAVDAEYVFDDLSVVRLGADWAITNGDFEQGDFTGWTVTDNGTGFASITSDPGQVHEGTYALRLSMGPEDVGIEAKLRQDVDMSADPDGTRYIGRIHVNSIVQESTLVTVTIKAYGASGGAPKEYDLVNVEPYFDEDHVFTWRKNAGFDYVKLRIYAERLDKGLTSVDEIIIDDIRIVKEPAWPTANFWTPGGTPANQAPEFHLDPFTEINANKDVPYSSSIADDASDPDPADVLTFSKDSGPAWLNVAADGTLSGTPSVGDIGLNAFTVQVDDGNGGTDTATMNITVINVGNNAPTFTADPLNKADATEDSAYSDSIAGDATDPDSDPLVFSKVSGPAWLTVAANGNLSGTPGTGDVGLNSWTVECDDGNGGTDTATLNITVLNTNDAPSFTSDPVVEIDATEDAAYSSTLADDATDPDVGDTLFFSLVTGPTWLSVAGDGSLSGTPATGDVGLNSWTVQVDDDSAAYDQATLEITVDAAGGQLPGQAGNPSPSDGAKKLQNPVTLSWTAGTDATSHDVYFGTDSTPDSGEFQRNQAGTTFDPGSLSSKTNYYWRIDEVNAQGTTTGTVWTFKTK